MIDWPLVATMFVALALYRVVFFIVIPFLWTLTKVYKAVRALREKGNRDGNQRHL